MLLAFKPTEVDFTLITNQIAQPIHLVTFFKEYAAVAALAARHEKYEMVARGKLGNVRHAVGHLAADGVEVAELGRWLDALADVVHHLAETFQRFGRLAEETDVAAEV